MILFFYVTIGIAVMLPGPVNSQEFRCKKTGVFAVPGDCNSYFRCIPRPEGPPGAFHTEIERCRAGTVFNPRVSSCDLPKEVPECDRTTAYNNTYHCIRSGDFPHPTDCSRWVRCFVGSRGYRWEIYFCPRGQLFNPQRSLCDNPRNIPSCDQSTTSICLHPGTFAYPGDCGRYVECRRDPYSLFGPLLRQVNACPQGLFYNAARGSCDRQGTVGQCVNFRCSRIGRFPHPNDCSRYIRCLEDPRNPKGPLLQEVGSCPAGYYFNPRKLLCDISANVPECQRSTLPPPCQNRGVFWFPNDCSRFYVCSYRANPSGYIQTSYACPQGFYYNIATGQCDWPRNVACPY